MGVQRFYQYFDDQGIPIKCHPHDNNASVSKYLRKEQPDTKHAKDTWHATKGVSRDAKICAGPAYQAGKVWHRELADKAASLKTDLYFCMKNCGGEADKLRRTIDSIVCHYKGDHSQCNRESRCKKDCPYIPSKTVITSPVVEDILVKFLHKTPMYRDAENYRYCMDTHYVEFQQQPSPVPQQAHSIWELQYKQRVALAILDWNEHVDRTATSL